MLNNTVSGQIRLIFRVDAGMGSRVSFLGKLIHRIFGIVDLIAVFAGAFCLIQCLVGILEQRGVGGGMQRRESDTDGTTQIAVSQLVVKEGSENVQ